MLIQSLFSEPTLFFLWVVAIIVALTIHEFSHALAGKLQGDPTAELDGRLTLNPLSHIDWLGFALLVIVGFGWAKPTPFNPYNLKFKKWGAALVALAGPISNAIVVVLIGTVLAIVVRTTNLPADNLMIRFFLLLIEINVLLGIFNLFPIPPLDGSKVLYSFIGDRYPHVVQFLETYGTYLLIAFIIFGGGFLTSLFQIVYSVVLNAVF
jgi:Zn-dependent protease